MSCITVKSFDKEYSIPSDVVTYVGLVDFTNQVRDSLMSSFKRQIRPSVDVIESDTFMISALNEQASKFISKLLENDIYDRTANDYLQNNKGCELFLDTKKKVVNQLISIRTEKLNTYRAGVEDAIYRKESSVTGLDFGVITGSFVNSMIYAYMDASEQTKQEKEALKVYNREIEELNKQVAMYDRQESDYIIGNVIPAMNTVFTFFAYELLDKFIADLIRYDKFDGEALKFINLERSNDLLKNLSLAGNKKAVIESAFVACPFNANVYSQALNYGFIDYDTYLTAHYFKQDENILNTLTEKLGEVTYPDKFKINYTAAEQLAKCTGRDVKAILQEKTSYYANAVVKSYKDIINLLGDKDFAVKTIYEFPESAILAGDAISKGQASSVVEKLVKQNIWLELVDKCGHSNLIDDIKKLIPEADNVFTKRDLDSLLTDKLYSLFEAVRLERAKAINEKKEQERIAKQEAELAEKERQEKRAAKKEENKRKFKKALKIFLPGLLAVIVIFFATSFVINDVIKPAKQYKAAVALMESGDYQGAINIFASLGRYKDSENLSAQCINADLEATYNTAVQLMGEGKFADAAALFETLNGYKDSGLLITECIYDTAVDLMASCEYSEAISVFEELNGFKDSVELIKNCQTAILDDTLTNAKDLIAKEEYQGAINILEELGEHKDSYQQLKIAKYGYANTLLTNGDYNNAATIFKELGDYENSSELYKQSKYSYALLLMGSESYNSAITIFDELEDFPGAQENSKECKYLVAKDYVNLYDYDSAKNLFINILGYKDSNAYLKLIDNIISKVYYNDEYRGTHYIWAVSKINTESCSEELYFFECRDDIGTDDEFIDYYQGYNVQWKVSGTKIFASSDGEAAEGGYTLYTISAGRNILTSQYISTDGEAKVVDTYKLMPDGRAQYVKEEWISYLEDNVADDVWRTAEATVDVIDDYSDVERTSEGIVFYINGLKWHMSNGWGAMLNSDATAALVTFSEGEYWGDTERIYISYEGQYTNLTEYMSKNRTNGTFTNMNIEGCREAYVCYEGLLDENSFESNTVYVICQGSVFKISYVADSDWYSKTQIKDVLSGADFTSYYYE